MAAFLITATAMLCIALGFLLLALLRRPRHAQIAAENSSQDVVALYRQQMTEVESDLSSGLLDTGHHQEARQELKRRMLVDLPQAALKPAAQWQRSPKSALGVLTLVRSRRWRCTFNSAAPV